MLRAVDPDPFRQMRDRHRIVAGNHKNADALLFEISKGFHRVLTNGIFQRDKAEGLYAFPASAYKSQHTESLLFVFMQKGFVFLKKTSFQKYVWGAQTVFLSAGSRAAEFAFGAERRDRLEYKLGFFLKPLPQGLYRGVGIRHGGKICAQER